MEGPHSVTAASAFALDSRGPLAIGPSADLRSHQGTDLATAAYTGQATALHARVRVEIPTEAEHARYRGIFPFNLRGRPRIGATGTVGWERPVPVPFQNE